MLGLLTRAIVSTKSSRAPARWASRQNGATTPAPDVTTVRGRRRITTPSGGKHVPERADYAAPVLREELHLRAVASQPLAARRAGGHPHGIGALDRVGNDRPRPRARFACAAPAP